MSEETIQVGDQPNTDSVPVENQTKNDTVAYDTYTRVLGEKKKTAEKLKEAQTALAQFETEKKSTEENKLKETEQWKTLWEKQQKELEEEKLKTVEFMKRETNSIKYNAFLSALPGKLVKSDYLTFVDPDQIQLEENGTVNEVILNDVVSNFVKDHGRLILNDSSKSLPADAAQPGSSVQISYDDWLKLPTAADKKARWKDVNRS